MTQIGFADLFERLGTADPGYSPLAAALSGAEVEITGFVVATHEGGDRIVLTDAPGVCPDCVPAAVPVLELPGFQPGADVPHAGARAVRLRGRLSYGFAIAADGYASFLRLEDARVARDPRR